MKRIAPFAIIGIFVLITGCSPSHKVLKSQPEPGFALGNYTTFGFFDVEAAGDTVPASFDANLQLIKNAISRNLKARGLNPAPDPALRINIALTVTEKSQTRQTDFRTDGLPRYMGQRRYSWKSEEVEVGRYKEGTMLIDLVDARNNRLVWKGGGEGVIPGRKHLEEAISGMVDEVMKEVP